MGTRNLPAIKKDGKFVVAQYGQWDGYPSGQGFTVLDFLAVPGNLAALESRIPDIRLVTGEEVDAMMDAAGIVTTEHPGLGRMISMDEADRWKDMHPQLYRNMGAGVLQFIVDSPAGEIVLMDSSEFLMDELFCEWAYIVDVDSHVLEVYVGGCGKIQTFPLGSLPDKPTFEHACYKALHLLYPDSYDDPDASDSED